MGNTTTRAQAEQNEEDLSSIISEEMSSAQNFHYLKGRLNDQPRPLETLMKECRELRQRYQNLTDAIEDIFEDKESEETTPDLETRLYRMTLSTQDQCGKLIHDLECHAKLVCARPNLNDILMKLVKELVSIVNAYMTMLIRNIRKLKRLVEEAELPKSLDTEDVDSAHPIVSHDLSSTNIRGNVTVPKRRNTSHARLVYEVVSDFQDVDAMLIQLQETQAQREELERDMVTVLACWRGFTTVVTYDDDVDPEDVMLAADGVVAGLMHIRR